MRDNVIPEQWLIYVPATGCQPTSPVSVSIEEDNGGKPACSNLKDLLCVYMYCIPQGYSEIATGERYYDDEFYVSIWLNHRARYLVKHFPRCSEAVLR